MIPTLLHAVESGAARLASFVEHLPMLIPPTTTDRGEVAGRDGSIAAEMNEVAEEMERRPGVLDCTCFHGFFKSDTPDVGMHVLVTAVGGDKALAQRTACEMAAWIWERRDRFKQANYPPHDAVQLGLRESEASNLGPVVLHEISDNPGSGAPGDGTHLLRAMIIGAKVSIPVLDTGC